MKKLLTFLSNKIFIISLLVIIQLAIFVLIVTNVSIAYKYAYALLEFFSIIVALYILGENINPSYKLAWIIPILVVPLIGGLMYILYGRQPAKKKLKAQMEAMYMSTSTELVAVQDEMTRHGTLAAQAGDSGARLNNFIFNQSLYPAYDNSATEFYPSGEAFHAAHLEQLKKAEKFIFMEYFIIEEGVMWNAILNILIEKAKAGVEVYLMYDDVGCLFTLPNNYDKILQRLGIKCKIFSRLRPSLDVRMNNRTHRKITVIDGKVAFTGGVNLADEYINERERFGHWKDTAIRVEGKAVLSFSVMFIRFWNAFEKNPLVLSNYSHTDIAPLRANGFVQPISDTPFDKVQLIENIFIHMLNNATKYVYINTPYLILDNEIVTALCTTAQSGIDVRITLPHIADKAIVHMMSRSFYPILLASGVKIYEYTPGFIHSKMVICDDKIGFVGTTNMDYRSFYLHFECGAVLYNTDSLITMYNDYITTLAKCKEITSEEANDVTIFTRIGRSIVRVFAPML